MGGGFELVRLRGTLNAGLIETPGSCGAVPILLKSFLGVVVELLLTPLSRSSESRFLPVGALTSS